MSWPNPDAVLTHRKWSNICSWICLLFTFSMLISSKTGWQRAHHGVSEVLCILQAYTGTVLLAQLSSKPYMVPQTLVLGDDSNFIIKFYKTNNFLMCLGIHSALSAILPAWCKGFLLHGGGCGCMSGESPARASELTWVPHYKPAL